MTRLFVILFLFHLLLPAQAKAEEKPVLNIGTFSYPPILHMSQMGEFSGTMGETVKMMCERAQIKCNVSILPFKRAYLSLERGHIDGLITIKLDRFTSCCTSTDWASPWAAGIFTRNKDERISRPEELLGSTLITVAGMKSPYQFIPELDNWRKEKKIEVFEAPSSLVATAMYARNRAQYLFGSNDFNWYFEKLNLQDKQYFIPLIRKPVTLWLQKAKTIELEKLNTAFGEMVDEGLINEKQLLIDDLMKHRYLEAPFQS